MTVAAGSDNLRAADESGAPGWFDHGVAEQAATFYVAVFPNSAVGAVTHYGPDTPGPEGGVMTVEFTLDGQPYVGLNGGDQFRFSEAISVQIRCSGQEEVDHYRERLSDGGQPARAAGSPTGSASPGRSNPWSRTS